MGMLWTGWLICPHLQVQGLLQAHCDVPGPKEIYHINQNWYSITDGQPYAGVFTTSYTTIDVKAGRHKSTKVAQAFTQNLSPQNMAVARSSAANFPAQLNFALSTDMEFDFNGSMVTCHDLRIAQGSF